MRRLLDYLRLCRWHFRLAVTALLAVIAARLSLCLLPFRLLQKFSAGPSDNSHAGGAESYDAARRARIAGAVRIASRLVPQATCLSQALAAQTLLRLRGDWTKLCIGVAKGEHGEFRAHAWLEAEGAIILGDSPDHGRFRPFVLSATQR